MLRTPAGLSFCFRRLERLPLVLGVGRTTVLGRRQLVVKGASHATLVTPSPEPPLAKSGKLDCPQRPPLHDNPCEILQATKQRKRRQADSTAIASIVRHLAEERSEDGGPPPRVVLEMPQPNRLNGKWSWYACGHSYGVWHGALASHGFKVETVTSRAWKIDLQLNGKGKEGSRLLALRLFPSAAELLKRKKDHGRAEAMLIAAWALGLRIQPDSEEVAVVPPVETQKASLDDLLSEEDEGDSEVLDS
ncbi:hypothetical protein WJX75_000945 [Coccomyxa subellipsoidea]|uniref:Uncharacterized protein n=1 Tax=Coccomyxa subellipsoidea TaxID=248742 RepID=A0ABR2Z0C2_9CHLO